MADISAGAQSGAPSGEPSGGQSGAQPSDARRRLLALAAVLVLLAVATIVVVLARGGRGKTINGVPPTRPTSPPVQSGCGVTPAVRATPTAAQLPQLAGRVGFGAEVTGGAGAPVVHVTTDADSGPGSLRAAVSAQAPAWIMFDKDMTIKITKPLSVCSNKTIDGIGRKVEITGHGVEGLDLIGVSNVIIANLTLHDFGDTAKTKNNNTPDAIHLDHSHGVWINHCDLSMAGDKLIAVSNGSSAVTVSWNHLHNQEQVFQIGNQATGPADTVQTVTIEHNFFDHTGYRNPVVSYGKAHVYNNYFLDWRLYGVRAERTGQMYLQNNIFRAGPNPRATLVTPAGKGCNDAKTHCDSRSGYLLSVGNLLLGGAKVTTSDPTKVFDPAKLYKFTAAPATQALADTIAAQAGPNR